MQKYTQEDFENFEVIDGVKICPKGNYTEIKSFPSNCRFERGSRFGDETKFDGWCHFEDECTFGKKSLFGKRCTFEQGCCFEERCEFRAECSIGENCYIGKNCRIDETCYMPGRLTPFEKLLMMAAKESERNRTEVIEVEDNFEL